MLGAYQDSRPATPGGPPRVKFGMKDAEHAAALHLLLWTGITDEQLGLLCLHCLHGHGMDPQSLRLSQRLATFRSLAADWSFVV